MSRHELQWVGRFIETAAVVPGLVSIRTVIGTASESAAKAQADYLRNGTVVIDVMGNRHDVIGGGAIAETLSVLTDGQWITDSTDDCLDISGP